MTRGLRVCVRRDGQWVPLATRGAGFPADMKTATTAMYHDAILKLAGRLKRNPSIREIATSVGRSTTAAHFAVRRLARLAAAARAKGERA